MSKYNFAPMCVTKDIVLVVSQPPSLMLNRAHFLVGAMIYKSVVVSNERGIEVVLLGRLKEEWDWHVAHRATIVDGKLVTR